MVYKLVSHYSFISTYYLIHTVDACEITIDGQNPIIYRGFNHPVGAAGLLPSTDGESLLAHPFCVIIMG